jgi:uncharacterized protein YbjT (DUF2867 family)
MPTVVMFGGNGYIGRAVSREWLARDAEVRFIVLSGSGKNALTDPRSENRVCDVTDIAAVRAAVPESEGADYVVDFVGRPDKDEAAQKAINAAPARVMRQFAEERHALAMGFIGGVLGPKSFVALKAAIVAELQASPVRLAYVNPTLVYGAGRKDSMARMVPLLKVAGVFSKKLRPVRVSTVARQLVDELVEA